MGAVKELMYHRKDPSSNALFPYNTMICICAKKDYFADNAYVHPQLWMCAGNEQDELYGCS